MSEQQSHKVLIVDDEEDILKALNRGLHREPYEKLFADSAASAIEFFAEHEISVIITDMRMPGMNGLELLEMVSDISPNTVKIVLTGYTKMPQMLATVNRVDIFKFLTKPWDLESELKVYIREAIDQYEKNKITADLLKGKEQRNNMYQKLLTEGYEKVDHFMDLYEKLMKVINYHHLLSIEELRVVKSEQKVDEILEIVNKSVRHLNVRMNFINRVFDFSRYLLRPFSLSDIAHVVEKQVDYKTHVEVEDLEPPLKYNDNLKLIMGIITEILDFPLLYHLPIHDLVLKEEMRENQTLLFFKMVCGTNYQMSRAVEENEQFIKMVIMSVGGVIDHHVVDENLNVTIAFKVKQQEIKKR